MHRDGAFPFLDEPKVEALYRFFLDRSPTHAEHLWMRNNCNDSWLTNGVMAFQWPWDATKPVLLIYACCHGAQLCKYWLEFSQSGYVRGRYNLVFIQNYRVQGDAHYLASTGESIKNPATLPDEYRELFLAVWRKAELVITHPAYGGTAFDPGSLFSNLGAKHARMLKFHSPSFGALWPVCLYGDDWVKKLLRGGMLAEEIKEVLAKGHTNADLPSRFTRAYGRLLLKDTYVDTPIAGFFETFCRRHRMFVTFNHPSFHLMGLQAMQLEARLAGKTIACDPAHILALPWNACNFQPVWPDHQVTHTHLRLVYPMGYSDTVGFYDNEIDRCAREVAAESK